MKELIVTADDFGAAPEVNDAVEVAHRDGILTAASLMVTGPAAADAIARARRLPSLKVGLHLVLVEGRPVLPAAVIPDLVDKDGSFRANMAQAGANMFFRPTVRRQLAAEIAAQFEAFRASGLTLDHVNAHKHFHLHPTISSLIVGIGCRFGMTAARIPWEPRTILRQAEPTAVLPTALLLMPWMKLMRATYGRAGLLVPNQVFGLAWSGAMTEPRLAGILRHLPAGLSEIYLHPATSGGFDGAASGYRYAEEFAALTAPSVMEAVRHAGVKLGAFADFQMAARRP
ncbi:hopanoid biosynthesis-associated protein HpnK [Dongia soli]|uniref:Hopanoid biosynthesis-associated protein HpnK n=1 Tax=Dongia soli TaxID=600628 RepID=A0ABU5E7E1_9PROT|nr:hopanoid biosynthesis-associated protein HpnK [Dongia soli]MDY0882208.1 hopanoid biosynthesis-associated protein HpnK [Dongia soli]